MKKFLLKTIYMTAPVLGILLGVNYFGDAANIFNKGYEESIAEILSDGEYVTNISNYDERLIQEELIVEKGIAPPQIIVLGSSRAMLIRQTFFSNKKFLNNSVSGATLYDLIAIYQMYKLCGILPEKVIVGLDPEMFNENRNSTRWKSIAFYYEDFYNRKSNDKMDHFGEIFSISYFQSSLEKIPSRLMSTSSPISTRNEKNTQMTKLTDGSINYGKSFRRATLEEINRKARDYSVKFRKDFENYDEISQERWRELKNLISDMRQNGLEIEFFLSPYHPSLSGFIQDDFEIVSIVENNIREFAESQTILVRGSFDPKRLRLEAQDFYDGRHANEKAIRQIFNSILLD